MYPTDGDIDYAIEFHSKIVMMLTEVKEKRIKEIENSNTVKLEPKHFVVGAVHVKDSDKIHTVKCNCGRVTKYRKPLKTLEDFECPNKKPIEEAYHKPSTWHVEMVIGEFGTPTCGDRVTDVTCKCGVITTFKKPLKNIEAFICPDSPQGREKARG